MISARRRPIGHGLDETRRDSQEPQIPLPVPDSQEPECGHAHVPVPDSEEPEDDFTVHPTGGTGGTGMLGIRVLAGRRQSH